MSQLPFDVPVFHDTLDDVPPPCASRKLVGHEDARDRISRAIDSGHHAIILSGEKGIGKATTAFHVARTVLEGRVEQLNDAVVDVDSQLFRQVAQNAHPNLLYLTRPLNETGKAFRTVITVDEIRRLQRFLGMSASGTGYRVVIIDSVGDMNRNAANALLKFLEEPPANTLFLLIAHGLGRVLPTIRSRCQVVRFSPLMDAEFDAVLNAVATEAVAPDEISKLVALSGWSVGHALLMALNGGVELKHSLDALFAENTFNTAQAHKLADVAAARGANTHNMLLRIMMVDRVQNAALASAGNGDIEKADEYARLEAELEQRARYVDGYNLDIRQEFLIIANKIHGALNGA